MLSEMLLQSREEGGKSGGTTAQPDDLCSSHLPQHPAGSPDPLLGAGASLTGWRCRPCARQWKWPWRRCRASWGAAWTPRCLSPAGPPPSRSGSWWWHWCQRRSGPSCCRRGSRDTAVPPPAPHLHPRAGPRPSARSPLLPPPAPPRNRQRPVLLWDRRGATERAGGCGVAARGSRTRAVAAQRAFAHRSQA